MKHSLLSSPPSQQIELGGLTYTLEGESRWSAQYRSGKNILVISKVLAGHFDMNWLKDNDPSQLPEDERNPAAVALYVAGEREDIPAPWRRFAVSICGPEGEAVKRPKSQEAEQAVSSDGDKPSN